MSFQQRLHYVKLTAREMFKHPGLGTLSSCYKHFTLWQKLLNSDGTTVSAQLPWLTFGAIDYLEKVLNDQMNVFEYGSGGSTLYWSSRVKKVVSVEHNKEWFATMQKQFIDLGRNNIEYIFKEPVSDPFYSNKKFNNPDDYLSSDQEFTGKNFEDYVKTIDVYQDGYFDLIIVDGRARPSCISHSISKLKKGGYLVVDNSDREYYLAAFNFAKPSWERWNFPGPVPFLKHFSMTTILKKLPK